VKDTTGAESSVNWLGDSTVLVQSHQSEDAFRVLISNWDHGQIFGTEWSESFEIVTSSPVPLNIVAAQASTFPGVSMVVRAVHPAIGTAQISTITGMPR